MATTTTTSQGTVSLEDARRVIAAGEDRAREIEQPQNIAVVDAGGNLVSHIRMDGAWIGSVDIAINKAFTARAFDLPTADLADNSQPGGQFYGIQESNKGRVMIFAGGIPLKRDGEVVGAVGVSGGDGDQDSDGRRGRGRRLLSASPALLGPRGPATASPVRASRRPCRAAGAHVLGRPCVCCSSAPTSCSSTFASARASSPVDRRHGITLLR